MPPFFNPSNTRFDYNSLLLSSKDKMFPNSPKEKIIRIDQVLEAA